MYSYLLKLSEERQEVQKKTYAHEPFTESTRQMGMVSLCEENIKNMFSLYLFLFQMRTHDEKSEKKN